MNYYLFCYHSLSTAPDLAEAQQIVEQQCSTEGLPRSMLSSLARKLTAYNPDLAQYAIQNSAQSDLAARPQSGGKRTCYEQILLIEKETRASPRIDIYCDNISIGIPAVSSVLLAEQAIDKVTAYLEIICEQTGYFVYDPQTGQVDDCSHACIDRLKTYLLDGTLIGKS